MHTRIQIIYQVVADIERDIRAEGGDAAWLVGRIEP